MVQEGFTKENARKFGELFARRYGNKNQSQTTQTAPSNNNAIKTAANNVRNNYSTPTVPNVPTSRTNQTLTQMQDSINQGFSYDPDDDPALKAARRLAEQQMRRNQVNTNAMLRASGQGKSSWSETVANQIAGDTASRISNELVPHYANLAYQQYQDRINNLGNLYGNQYQQDVTRPIAEAGVTGIYQPPSLMNLYNDVLNLKNQWSAASPEERAAIEADANAKRNQILALGGDPSLVGADVTLQQAQANTPRFGIPTMEAARMNWEQNPENPANQAQQLQNQMYQYELEELMNPQSRTNILRDLELQVARMEAEYLPQEQQLKIQQLQREIANIGARPPQTAAEAEYDRLRVEQLRKEIDLMDQENPAQAKIDPKESTDNLSQAKSYVDTLSNEEAKQYAQGIKGYLSDSDYRSLINYIDDNL